MALIKEALEVVFYVDPKPMTQEDGKAISDLLS